MTPVLDHPGMLRGIRSRHYSSAATAALKYPAQSLTPLDTAANATVASTACVRHQNLSTGWTPVLGTNLTAGTFLTHTGSYRVRARVYTTSAVPPKLRWVYDVGDLTLPAENTAVAIPGTDNFYLVDLGEVRLDKVNAGAHRWQGVVQAKGAVGGENVSVAELEFQPLDEAAGSPRFTATFEPGLETLIARDEFNQTAGALTGKTLPVGGTWGNAAGDADDWVLDTTNRRITRTATGGVDSPIGAGLNGRVLLASAPSPARCAVKVDAQIGTPGFSGAGVVLRYTDANNWLIATFDLATSTSPRLRVFLLAAVGGALTVLHEATPTPVPVTVDSWFTAAAIAQASGQYMVAVGPQGSTPTVVVAGQSSLLATGGALASGKVGIRGGLSATGAVVRMDNFAAWVPAGDAVLFASQSAALSTDGMSREDATGVAYGPISDQRGDIPRIPASGAEERPVELFLRGSRGDLGSLPDPALDSISVKPFVRPSWLLTPGA